MHNMSFTHPFQTTFPLQAPPQKSRFPVGYHNLHSDVSLNFQMNRFFNLVGDARMLNEMRSVSADIDNPAHFTREFMILADCALNKHEWLKGAFFLRAAEFFMLPDNPAKRPARAQFLKLVRAHYRVSEADHSFIPYDGGALLAYRFTTTAPKGTVVVFGGFDSYIEEWFGFILALRDAGYDIIAFDGPGQGSALEDFQLPLTHEWEKPVKAVLDYYDTNNVTLLGFSLGGELVIRAAAHEPRVRRIIADNVLTDFSEVVLQQVDGVTRLVIKSLVLFQAARAINGLVTRAAAKSPVIAWGLQQGMHVTGCRSPYEFLKNIRCFSTAAESARVTQDVLLLGATHDHYVPPHQFLDQTRTLRNVRSLTTRVFTQAEHARGEKVRERSLDVAQLFHVRDET